MKCHTFLLGASLVLAACATGPGKNPPANDAAAGPAPVTTDQSPAPAPAPPAPALPAPALASTDAPGGTSVEPAKAVEAVKPEDAQASPGAASPPSDGAFTDAASVERWMASYYLHPELDRFVEAFKALDASGALGNEPRAWGYSAFFTELMRRNPGSVPMWCDAMGPLKEPGKKWWWTAVWQSDTEGGALAIKEARALPEGHARRIDYRWLDDKHRNILQTQIRGPQQIDMLWHAFGASGDELFVLEQFEGLIEFPVREPTSAAEETIAARRREAAKRTTAIARASLLAHAKSEPRVLEICKANTGRLKPEPRFELEKIIAQAEGRAIPTPPAPGTPEPKAPAPGQDPAPAAPGPGE